MGGRQIYLAFAEIVDLEILGFLILNIGNLFIRLPRVKSKIYQIFGESMGLDQPVL